MSWLNYCRIGRMTLWQGAPVRVAVRTDPAGELLEPGRPGAPPVSLSISHVETGQSLRFDLEATQEMEGLHRLEISTAEVPVGAHEVRVRIGREEVFGIPEALLVLDRAVYRDWAVHRAKERFLPSPALRGGDAVEQFVEALVRRFLEDGVFDRDVRLFFVFTHTPEGVLSRQRFASAPIRWTTQAVLDALLDLFVFGAEHLHWRLGLTSRTFKIAVDCKLLSSLSDVIVRSLRDQECGDLFLLNAAGDLREFKVQLGVAEGERHVTLSVEHRIDEFPTSD